MDLNVHGRQLFLMFGAVYCTVFRWFGLANIFVIPVMFLVIRSFGDRPTDAPLRDLVTRSGTMGE